MLNQSHFESPTPDCAAAVPFGRNLRAITRARSQSFYTGRCVKKSEE